MRRREIVVRSLLAMRVPDADVRVVVSPDLATRYRAGETAATYYDTGNNQNGRNGWGGGGWGGGFGGGGFGGGFGGGIGGWAGGNGSGGSGDGTTVANQGAGTLR